MDSFAQFRVGFEKHAYLTEEGPRNIPMTRCIETKWPCVWDGKVFRQATL